MCYSLIPRLTRANYNEGISLRTRLYSFVPPVPAIQGLTTTSLSCAISSLSLASSRETSTPTSSMRSTPEGSKVSNWDTIITIAKYVTHQYILQLYVHRNTYLDATQGTLKCWNAIFGYSIFKNGPLVPRLSANTQFVELYACGKPGYEASHTVQCMLCVHVIPLAGRPCAY